MSEKWLSGVSSEAGILRKAKPTQVQENFDDLLIFGYACKIFRDNERAKLIDHGKHLIPWMGDNSLKIDRLILIHICKIDVYTHLLFKELKNNNRNKLFIHLNIFLNYLHSRNESNEQCLFDF